MVVGVSKKFQMTNLNMLNNISSMKYALKSVPGLADIRVLHGEGDQPQSCTLTLMVGGVRKKFQMTNLAMPNIYITVYNNIYSI